MASLIVRVDSIINIYDHFNVTPVPHVIRREANQLDLPTGGWMSDRHCHTDTVTAAVSHIVSVMEYLIHTVATLA